MVNLVNQKKQKDIVLKSGNIKRIKQKYTRRSKPAIINGKMHKTTIKNKILIWLKGIFNNESN